MAHLTKPETYNIKDSNIALLGSDLEKRVHEHAGDKETAWSEAGLAPGLQVWRVEKFHIVSWPKDQYGSFYEGDSYVVLHTYKKTPDVMALSYDLHFWLGENTSQDEAGTAAYKTVELDDHLHGLPVQYREVQGCESSRFLSYFAHFVCRRGGISSGFHHVSGTSPATQKKLYRISASRHGGGKPHFQIREVAAEGPSLVEGDVFVLDKGKSIWQLNTKECTPQEKYHAVEFAQKLANDGRGVCDVTTYDEGPKGRIGSFLAEFGVDSLPAKTSKATPDTSIAPTLYRLNDATGSVTFEPVEPATFSSLVSSDAFLLDHSTSVHPAIYIWIGKTASIKEQRLAVQYAQDYAHKKQSEAEGFKATINLIKMSEGHETEEFIKAFETSI